MTDEEIETTIQELMRMIDNLTERVERLESYIEPYKGDWVDYKSPLLNDKC